MRRRGSGWPRRLLEIIAVAVFLLVAALVATALDGTAEQALDGHPTVNDGDSLTFGSVRVRLRGIDAPEYRQTCSDASGQSYACGNRSREALVGLIAGGAVTCAASETDRYGRLLAVCRAGDIELNAAMVARGWAVAYGDYHLMEAEARGMGVGLWAGQFDRPRDWRVQHGGLFEVEHRAMRLLLDRLASLFPLS